MSNSPTASTASPAPTDRLGIEAVARAAFNPAQQPPGIEPGFAESGHFTPATPTFPNGCHVCEVEIEPDTGLVHVVGYRVVDDFGTVINPLLLRGQVQGGVGQGIGQAMLEQCVYDSATGQLVTGSLIDYCLPRADDLPAIGFATNVVPCRTNPLGVKGAGEAGAIGAPPALVNAVVDALSPLGIEHLDMPLTSERLWRAIRAAAAASRLRRRVEGRHHEPLAFSARLIAAIAAAWPPSSAQARALRPV